MAGEKDENPIFIIHILEEISGDFHENTGEAISFGKTALS
jgi:hypothetical protein